MKIYIVVTDVVNDVTYSCKSVITRYSRKVPGPFLLCHLFSKKKVKTSHTSGENILLHNSIYIKGLFHQTT